MSGPMLIAIVVLVVCMAGLCVLFVFAFKKKPLSAAEFAERLKEKGYYTYDESTNIDSVTCAKSAEDSSKKCRISFYEFSDKESALNFYGKTISDFKRELGSAPSDTNADLLDYHSRTVEADGKYIAITCVKNSVMLSKGRSENKKYHEGVKILTR